MPHQTDPKLAAPANSSLKTTITAQHLNWKLRQQAVRSAPVQANLPRPPPKRESKPTRPGSTNMLIAGLNPQQGF